MNTVRTTVRYYCGDGDNTKFKIYTITSAVHRFTTKVRIHSLFECAKPFPRFYICKICCNKFGTLVHLKNHIKEHSLGKKKENCFLRRYICGNCPYETYSSLQWIKHETDNCLKSENSSKFFGCEKCTYKEKKMRELKLHFMLRHSRDEDKIWLNCGRCSFKTLQKWDLKRHFSTSHDTEQMWFKCEKCSYGTIRKRYLSRHFLKNHATDGYKTWFKCANCDYKTLNTTNLKRHCFIKHPIDEYEIRLGCEDVKKWYVNKRKLAKHTNDQNKKY